MKKYIGKTRQTSKFLVNILKLFIFLSHFFLLSEGFVGDTLVKIVGGYKQIQDLKIGEEVLGYDQFYKKSRIQKVTKIIKTESDKFCRIIANNKIISAHLNQKFYIKARDIWSKSSELELGLNLGFFDLARICEIQITDKEREFYQITTEPNHNFFIESDILVHNFVVVLPVILEIPVAIKVAGAAITGLVTWFGLKELANNLDSDTIAKNKYREEKEKKRAYQGVTCFPNPEDPEEEFKKKHPNCRYEDEPYHHKNSSGSK